MKILSFAVPCYNSAAYMENCVNSLLKGGDAVEIIIVDDGSKDATAEIADRLEREHQGIVKAVHQENGGHGEAVNTGLKNATGLFFKVVDSDDWVDEDAYGKILDALKNFVSKDDCPDMLISNYVYEKEGAKKKKVIQYRNAIPVGKMFGWEDASKFKRGQYILMHSVIFKTQMLKDSGLNLPKHTFYVDNLYVFKPLTSVKKMYYLDVDFYRYYIGREDQSVNESVMIKRVDQQMRVNRLMFEYFSSVYKNETVSKKLKAYMYSYLEIITTISNILLILEGSDASYEKKRELYEWMCESDGDLAKKLRFGLLGRAMNLPGSFGRKLSIFGYHVAQKIFKFN